MSVIGKWSGEAYKRRIKAVAIVTAEFKSVNDKVKNKTMD